MRGREYGLDDLVVPRPIDNSQIVREVDPRSNRSLWVLLSLVTAVLAAAAFYAWPHVITRQTEDATQRLTRQRDHLVEQNRKLRLVKASLEDLARVETIATRDLGLLRPDPSQVVVVEEPPVAEARVRLASHPELVEAH